MNSWPGVGGPEPGRCPSFPRAAAAPRAGQERESSRTWVLPPGGFTARCEAPISEPISRAFRANVSAKATKLIDINSAEYGFMLRAKEHRLEGGLHPLGWNPDWQAWINKQKGPITKEMIDARLKEMMGSSKYKKFFVESKIAKRAVVSYSQWQVHLAKLAEKRAAKAAGKVVGKVAKKVGKALPFVGAVITVCFYPQDVQAKGWLGGSANTILDALPYVGLIKGGYEIITGKDVIPNARDEEELEELSFGPDPHGDVKGPGNGVKDSGLPKVAAPDKQALTGQPKLPGDKRLLTTSGLSRIGPQLMFDEITNPVQLENLPVIPRADLRKLDAPPGPGDPSVLPPVGVTPGGKVLPVPGLRYEITPDGMVYWVLRRKDGSLETSGYVGKTNPASGSAK